MRFKATSTREHAWYDAKVALQEEAVTRPGVTPGSYQAVLVSAEHTLGQMLETAGENQLVTVELVMEEGRCYAVTVQLHHGGPG